MTLEELRDGVLQRYGKGGVKVLDTYHSDYLFRKQLSEEECFFGDYPTLSSLSKQFDNKFPAAWLMAHLHDLSEFCGCKDKLQGHPLQQCASVIASEFYFLKISEIMLFFFRFKSGKYGRFYGSVDPLVITTSFRDFLKERAIAIERAEREEEALRREERGKDTMNAEEWLCVKTIIAMYNPEYVITAAEYRRLRANYSEKHEK